MAIMETELATRTVDDARTSGERSSHGVQAVISRIVRERRASDNRA